ncbi:hypothetical protein Droror1_Dr00012540 [Drosera rotundifolia]
MGENISFVHDSFKKLHWQHYMPQPIPANQKMTQKNSPKLPTATLSTSLASHTNQKFHLHLKLYKNPSSINTLQIWCFHYQISSHYQLKQRFALSPSHHHMNKADFLPFSQQPNWFFHVL